PIEPGIGGDPMTRTDRLERLFLSHLWACVPFALVWMLWPEVVGVVQEASAIRALRLVAAAAGGYLLVRTWLTFRPLGNVPWFSVCPAVDVKLISAALFVRPQPADSWLVLIYPFPVTQAAATLNLRWALIVGGLAAGSYIAACGMAGLQQLQYAYAAFRLFFL